MKKIYLLTAYNLQNKHQVEMRHFTSKKTALNQMSLLNEYLIEKYNLSVGNIENVGHSTDEIFTTYLDDVYNVSIRTFTIATRVSEYI